jgi:hypothetical protein
VVYKKPDLHSNAPFVSDAVEKNEKTRIGKMCWTGRADEDQMNAPIAAPSTIEFVDQEGVIESEIGRMAQPRRTSPSQARA